MVRCSGHALAVPLLSPRIRRGTCLTRTPTPSLPPPPPSPLHLLVSSARGLDQPGKDGGAVGDTRPAAPTGPGSPSPAPVPSASPSTIAASAGAAAVAATRRPAVRNASKYPSNIGHRHSLSSNPASSSGHGGAAGPRDGDRLASRASYDGELEDGEGFASPGSSTSARGAAASLARDRGAGTPAQRRDDHRGAGAGRSSVAAHGKVGLVLDWT
jgi:hypothetical protein